jgi:hypothetical protein
VAVSFPRRGVDLTPPKSRAVVDHLGLRKDADCFKEIKIGRVAHARYSSEAVKKIKDALKTESIDDIWEADRIKRRAAE